MPGEDCGESCYSSENFFHYLNIVGEEGGSTCCGISVVADSTR